MKTGTISVAHPADYGPACVGARHSFGWSKRRMDRARTIFRRCRRCGAEQVFVDTRRNRRGGAWQDAYDWPVGWERTSWGKAGKRRQQARHRAKRQAAQELVDAARWIASHA